ncbi:MAG: hypothetical protein IT365_01860 [Candidatus Hydrogenedentes bacterium]|nr:hypothetical protein [Candidatus Hydrogenedentota bacterium]
MHPRADQFQHWLTDYGRFREFRCAPYDNGGCAAYHVMAPLLHQLGGFVSFESYGPALRQVLNSRRTNGSQSSIMVAGIASEESARSLLSVLESLTVSNEVEFVDHCQTPLFRIRTMLEDTNYTTRIHTTVGDFLGDHAPTRRYDIVLADSLLRQFQPQEKVQVIQRLAQHLEPKTGMLLFREYVGRNELLLADLWQKLESYPSVLRWKSSVRNDAVAAFDRLYPELQRYMCAKGGSYNTLEDLKRDIRQGGLAEVETHDLSPQCQLVTCRRRIPTHEE